MKFKRNTVPHEFQPVELTVLVTSRKDLNDIAMCNNRIDDMVLGLREQAKAALEEQPDVKMMGGRDVPALTSVPELHHGLREAPPQLIPDIGREVMISGSTQELINSGRIHPHRYRRRDCGSVKVDASPADKIILGSDLSPHHISGGVNVRDMPLPPDDAGTYVRWLSRCTCHQEIKGQLMGGRDELYGIYNWRIYQRHPITSRKRGLFDWVYNL